jgi:hypothetical protein
MPRAQSEVVVRDKPSAAELREEARRCREESKIASDPKLKEMFALRAAEFAKLAEEVERPGKETHRQR